MSYRIASRLSGLRSKPIRLSLLIAFVTTVVVTRSTIVADLSAEIENIIDQRLVGLGDRLGMSSAPSGLGVVICDLGELGGEAGGLEGNFYFRLVEKLGESGARVIVFTEPAFMSDADPKEIDLVVSSEYGDRVVLAASFSNGDGRQEDDGDFGELERSLVGWNRRDLSKGSEEKVDYLDWPGFEANAPELAEWAGYQAFIDHAEWGVAKPSGSVRVPLVKSLCRVEQFFFLGEVAGEMTYCRGLPSLALRVFQMAEHPGANISLSWPREEGGAVVKFDNKEMTLGPKGDLRVRIGSRLPVVHAKSLLRSDSDIDLEGQVVFVRGPSHAWEIARERVPPVVERQADVVASLLRGNYQKIDSTAVRAFGTVLVFALTLLVCWVVTRMGGVKGAVLTFCLAWVWLAFSFVSFLVVGLRVLVVWPVLAILLALTLRLLWEWPRTVESSRKLRYDIFLLYNKGIEEDTQCAQRFANLLKRRGLRVYFDEWAPPGKLYQKQKAQAIKESRSALVFLGREGFGTAGDHELMICISENQRRRDFSVVPLVMKGASHELERRVFLREFRSIDLGNISETKAVRRLEEALPRQGEDFEDSGDLMTTVCTTCKILFISANSRGRKQMSLDEEYRQIKDAVSGSELRNFLDLESCFGARPSDLQRVLIKHRPHIVHLSCHGTVDEIILRDEEGNEKKVPVRAFESSVANFKESIRVVVLSSCYSADLARSLAQTVGCAVGVEGEIDDLLAIAFSRGFYRAVASSFSIQDAFHQGVSEAGVHEQKGPGGEWRLYTSDSCDASTLHLIRQPEKESQHPNDSRREHDLKRQETAAAVD